MTISETGDSHAHTTGGERTDVPVGNPDPDVVLRAGSTSLHRGRD